MPNGYEFFAGRKLVMLGSAAGYRNEDEKSTCLSEVGRSFFTLGNAFT